MKQAFSILAAAVLLAGLSGCGTDRMYVQQNGAAHRGASSRAQAARGSRPSQCPPTVADTGTVGPTGAVSYPYYTVRGPRDFLASDPPSIGP